MVKVGVQVVQQLVVYSSEGVGHLSIGTLAVPATCMTPTQSLLQPRNQTLIDRFNNDAVNKPASQTLHCNLAWLSCSEPCQRTPAGPMPALH